MSLKSESTGFDLATFSPGITTADVHSDYGIIIIIIIIME